MLPQKVATRASDNWYGDSFGELQSQEADGHLGAFDWLTVAPSMVVFPSEGEPIFGDRTKASRAKLLMMEDELPGSDDPRDWPDCSLDELVWLCIPEFRGRSVHLSDGERAEKTRRLENNLHEVNRQLDEIAYLQKYPQKPWTDEDVEHIKDCLRGAMHFIRLHILELMAADKEAQDDDLGGADAEVQ